MNGEPSSSRLRGPCSSARTTGCSATLLSGPHRSDGPVEGRGQNCHRDWSASRSPIPVYWRHPVSPTFHGRDVFAPVAAHISTGVPLREFGGAVSSIHVLAPPRPEALEGGDLLGHVLHIDHFGNIITDIQREDLPQEKFRLEVGELRIASLGQTYCEADGLTALIGSSGYLEIALKNGSAARSLGVKSGGRVRLVRSS